VNEACTRGEGRAQRCLRVNVPRASHAPVPLTHASRSLPVCPLPSARTATTRNAGTHLLCAQDGLHGVQLGEDGVEVIAAASRRPRSPAPRRLARLLLAHLPAQSRPSGAVTCTRANSLKISMEM